MLAPRWAASFIWAVGGHMEGAGDLTVMETPVEAGSTGDMKSARGYGKPVKHVAHCSCKERTLSTMHFNKNSIDK